ncbi:MAG TPA: penicillin-binding transpeptidase domain-containing protein [Polyangiaceae bacterium]
MRSVFLLLAGLLAGSTAAASAPPPPAGARPASGAVQPAPPSSERVPEVDLARLRVGPNAVVAPLRAGGTAELTLDPAAQRDAERLLEGARPRAGAILLLDLRSGRVLAWAERRRDASRSELTTARAPAASVFKLVTTAALFERANVVPSERVCIAGGTHGIERRHLDPPRSGDVRCGPFFQALGHSKNAAYAQLATHRLLRTDLLEVAERIGMNHDVPFDFPVPVGSLRVPYGDLDFARTAAGFEGSRLSPLGGAYLAAVVANGGLSPRLRIVARAGDYSAPNELEIMGRVLGSTTAHRLARMMEVTVEGGTAYSAFHDDLGHALLPGVRVAGKTGTLKPTGADGAASWFIGFAPSRAPRVAVSVLLENGAVWRRKAAEVARDAFRSYFAARGVRGIEPPAELAAR